MDAVVRVLVIALFVLFPVLALATVAAAHALKAWFPGVWQAEGEPEQWLWLQPSAPSQHIFNFLDQKRYLATGSPGFAKLCSAMRLGWYAVGILFVLALLAMGVALVGGGTAA